jgi:outer membrane protein assembly factor BamB
MDGGTSVDATTVDATMGTDATVEAGTPGAASVLEHHLHATRDGAYTDANVTTTAAGALKIDPGFTATVTGTIYGQPLYVDGWKTGQDAVFVATNMNHVTALNATTGAPLWDVTLGPPVAQTSLPCGQPYTSYGVMATPVIDVSTRTLYAESFQTPDGGKTFKHYVYALSIDTGATQTGWPVDVAAKVTGFTANTQNDRGGLTILNGTLYVPYAGLNGDCGSYHGWVVGISTTTPATVAAYSTTASQGGIWGAVASDGTSLYAVTGNTGGATTWGGGEALIRFTAGPKFSGATTDYFTPSNWATLDKYDGDLGSASSVLFDLPGATPSTLAVAAGKWGVAHLLNRASLGGVGTGNGTIGEGISSVVFAAVQNTENPPGSKGTPASYTTAKGRYVVLHSESNIMASACPMGSGDLIAFTVTAANPPKLVPAWCATSGGKGSPIATTTDGTSNALVWIVSTGGANKLVAFDGDTGAAVTNTAAALGTIQHWTSPIVAKGRFIVGGTNAVYALTTL